MLLSKHLKLFQLRRVGETEYTQDKVYKSLGMLRSRHRGIFEGQLEGQYEVVEFNVVPVGVLTPFDAGQLLKKPKPRRDKHNR